MWVTDLKKTLSKPFWIERNGNESQQVHRFSNKKSEQ